jgi:hypothetical protein
VTRRRRAALALIAIVVGAVIVFGWALPNAAGRLFVSVSTRLEVVGGKAGEKELVLPDGSKAPPGEVRIVAVITNHYPLPVVVEFRGAAIEASLLDRNVTNAARLWRGSASDPALESGDDSPDPGPGRVVVLQPGTTMFPATPDNVLAIDAAIVGELEPGIYGLRLSAYGISAGVALISVIEED